MTEQTLDRLIYEEYEHLIYAISGEGLLTPKDFGIGYISISTGCERGYHMVYSCVDGNLRLREMTVRARDDVYPAIGGFYQYRNIDELWAAKTYVGSRSVTSFTGGLIIGRKIRKGTGKTLHLNSWHSCQTIIELKFQGGKVQEEIDCSNKMDKYVNFLNYSELKDVFSLKYDFMYPLT